MAGQQPWPQPYWECVVQDEGAALGDPAHQLEELKDEIRQLWVLRIDDTPYLKKLVESLPAKIQEEIERDGNVTHY